MLHCVKTLSKFSSNFIMYLQQLKKVIVTTMIGFVICPPFNEKLIILAKKVAKWQT